VSIALLLAVTVAVTVYGPALLRAAGVDRRSTRAGLAAVHVVVASVLAGWLVVAVLVAAWADDVIARPGRALAWCAPIVAMSHLHTPIVVGAGSAIVAVFCGWLAWTTSRELRAVRRVARRHAEIARMIGRPLRGGGHAVLVEARERAVYCVPGRPGTVVVSAGAREILDDAELDAVLTHELTHLTERHHLVLALWRGVVQALPRLPLFGWAERQVAHLLELRADDAAARVHGRRAVASALVALVCAGATTPAGALGAAGGHVRTRVERLIGATPGSFRDTVRLAAAVAITVGAPLVAMMVTMTPVHEWVMSCPPWMH
jgi:Zn-dependent protease with chaperone function